MNLVSTPTTELLEQAAPVSTNTSAVIVTYHPEPSLGERVSRILPQVDRVLIVDNGSNPDASRFLRGLAADGRVDLIANDENLGIATALNQGARWSLDQGYKWMVTLDQDSEVEDDLLATLSAIYGRYSEREKVGVIGVNYWHAATNLLAYSARPSDGEFVEIETIITSGALTSLAAFQKVEGFRDELFIDSVDNEYCLRVIDHGYKVLMTTRPLLRHPLGDMKRHRLLWKRPCCSHHSPIRHYYATRNRLPLIWAYRSTQPGWAWREFKYMCTGLLLLLLYEKRKLTKLRAVLLGAWHALRGQAGKLSSGALGEVHEANKSE